MDFLYLLESIRTPFLDTFFSYITILGEETIFLVFAIAMFWCVNKRYGYYVMTVGFVGTVLNQFLKLVFHIPRPWVKDPNFTVVESAIDEATGYSFPSGHTQSAVTVFGTSARMTKNKILPIVCIIMVLLIGFSRMYLGVHTPADVIVSLIIGAVLTLAFYPFFKEGEGEYKRMLGLIIGMLVMVIVYVLYTVLYPFPADMDITNILHGQENGAKLLGAVAAILVVYILDEKVIHFDTKAPFWVQIVKCVVGFGILLAIKSGLKAPLNSIMPEMIGNAVRYFILVIFAGTVWPLTFKPLAKLGKKSK